MSSHNCGLIAIRQSDQNFHVNQPGIHKQEFTRMNSYTVWFGTFGRMSNWSNYRGRENMLGDKLSKIREEEHRNVLTTNTSTISVSPVERWLWRWTLLQCFTHDDFVSNKRSALPDRRKFVLCYQMLRAQRKWNYSCVELEISLEWILSCAQPRQSRITSTTGRQHTIGSRLQKCIYSHIHTSGV